MIAKIGRLIKCAHCGRLINSTRTRQRFCSRQCRSENRERELVHRPEWVEGKSAGTIGAVGELKVSADLMARGYEVFRALSPACSCDLAIIANGQLFRVEVRTGVQYPNGRLHYRRNLDGSRHDIMAVVLHDGDITYLPALP